MGYWSDNGKYQAEFDKFCANQNFLPSIGKSTTLEGELFRAVNKIAHDYYNNGWGNNWSGALNYIRTYGNHLILPKEYYMLKVYSYGRICPRHENHEEELENLLNRIMEYIISKNGVYEPNPCDMYALQEAADYSYYDDEQDEDAGED